MDRLKEELEKLTKDEIIGFRLDKEHFREFGGNEDDEAIKIAIIEKAIWKTRNVLKDALLPRSSTHAHKKNMVWAMNNQLRMLRYKLHPVWNMDKFLAKHYYKNVDELIKLFEPIFDIVSNKDFSHSEQRDLLRPYIFPFEQCNAWWRWENRFAEYRQEVSNYVKSLPDLNKKKYYEKKCAERKIKNQLEITKEITEVEKNDTT